MSVYFRAIRTNELTIKNKTMNTILKNSAGAFDRTIQSLCNQIDDLQDEVQYWRTKYEDEIRQQAIESNQRLEETQRGVANALMFALSVRDDEHGNLVIPKEERKSLAANWK
jgi:hypothetical protein